MRAHEASDMDVLILCGGLGTRLRPVVSDRPKPMAVVGGRPFLDILIGYVSRFGFRHFILCTGHMGDFIGRYYGEKDRGLRISISREQLPLGTAGAIKNAERFIRGNTFVCLNGDSMCGVDLKDFLKFHAGKRALASVVLGRDADGGGCGVARVDWNSRVTDFSEKAPVKGAYQSAGIYIFEKRLLSLIPRGRKVSLEYDVLPRIIGRGVYGYVTGKRFFDIGTPEGFSIFASRQPGERGLD